MRFEQFSNADLNEALAALGQEKVKSSVSSYKHGRLNCQPLISLPSCERGSQKIKRDRGGMGQDL
jgi:hypothetical protein